MDYRRLFNFAIVSPLLHQQIIQVFHYKTYRMTRTLASEYTTVTKHEDSIVLTKEDDNALARKHEDSSVLTKEGDNNLLTKYEESSILTTGADSNVLTKQEDEGEDVTNDNDLTKEEESDVTNDDDTPVSTKDDNDGIIVLTKEEEGEDVTNDDGTPISTKDDNDGITVLTKEEEGEDVTNDDGTPVSPKEEEGEDVTNDDDTPILTKDDNDGITVLTKEEEGEDVTNDDGTPVSPKEEEGEDVMNDDDTTVSTKDDNAIDGGGQQQALGPQLLDKGGQQPLDREGQPLDGEGQQPLDEGRQQPLDREGQQPLDGREPQPFDGRERQPLDEGEPRRLDEGGQQQPLDETRGQQCFDGGGGQKDVDSIQAMTNLKDDNKPRKAFSTRWNPGSKHFRLSVIVTLFILIIRILISIWGRSPSQYIGDVDYVCQSPQVIQPWQITAFRPKWFWLFGSPGPITYKTKGGKGHRVAIVDIDRRDIEIAMWVDDKKVSHRPVVLDNTVYCGEDLTNCINLGFGAAIVSVPPGKHIVKAEILDVNGTFRWEHERQRRVWWMVEQCS